jgi:virulence factor Mce-like protein
MAIFRRNKRKRGDDAARVPRKDRRGMKPVTAAILVLAVACVAVFLGFTKDIPFTKGYRVKAVFQSANSIRANSPVRIAGVEVGRVKKITRYKDTDMSLVEMEIQEKGLPIHKDATVAIRSRIFLEGNFFVDLSPGSPGAPTLDDGDTIRFTQTSSPVQLDEVLTALQGDTREDLKTLLDEFGTALQGDPAQSDALMDDADSSTRGETGAESLNDTQDDAGPALRGVSLLNEAFLGTEEHDLSRAIKGLQRVTAALGRNEGLLQSFVENFNGTLAIFADEKANVSATIRELPPTLDIADRTLADLNATFPGTRAFAREILPGVRESAPTIEAAFPWIRQTRGLLQQSELRGLAQDLRPTARSIAVATDAAVRFFPLQNLFARCLDEVILPTGDIKIVEPESRKMFETGVENYKEFWYSMVGLAGESQNFDGNGQYVRFQPGGGSQTLSTGRTNTGQTLVGNPASPPAGVRPRWPGTRPPYRPDVPCHTNPMPDLNSAVTAGPNLGQGPASGGPPPAGQGDGAPGSFPGLPSGPTPGLPTLPSMPPLATTPTVPGLPVAKARTAKAPAAQSSVTSELMSRLNPWRGAKKTPRPRKVR